MEIGNFTKIRNTRKVDFNAKTILFRLFIIKSLLYNNNKFVPTGQTVNQSYDKKFNPVEKLNWKKMSRKVPSLNVCNYITKVCLRSFTIVNS